MSSYKHIKNRPTPKIGNTVRIKRATGGYIIEIDSITNKALEYWRPLEVVCKSFNDVNSLNQLKFTIKDINKTEH